MQNIFRVHGRQLALLVAGLLVAGSLCLSAPPAYAADYEMPQVDIAIDVEDTGDVHVVEQRQFDLDGSFTCVWWKFGEIPENASIQVNGVTLRQGEADDVRDGKAHALSAVPFQDEWREEGGPGGEAYSWDAAETTLYVFFDASDESIVPEIDYTVENGVQAYDDMGEFFWQYVQDGWEVDSQDVTATVTLPVPAGQEVTGGENVYAWGHGPLDGSVGFGDDGTITFTSPDVPAGDYAAARVLFPVEWLTALPDSAQALHAGEEILPTALDQERERADAANAQRGQARLLVGVAVAIAVALVAWGVVMFRRWGRELRPRFAEKYWRDVPDGELPPAVIGRLMRFDAEDSKDFSATLMNLSAKGVVRIDKGSYANERGKTVEDYYLTLMRDALQATEVDELERKAIELVFDVIAGGSDQLWFKNIELYGKEHPEEFSEKMEQWQGALTAEVSKARLFEDRSESLKGTMHLVVGGYVVASLIAASYLENIVVLAPMVPAAIALLVIAHFMSRRTQRGADVAARADALKRWLKDFTRLDERPPTDVKVWGHFMVYAFLFGIADQVMKDLRMSVPAFRQDDDAFIVGMPYYYWYASPGLWHAGPGAAADVFDTTMTNTLGTVAAAISDMADAGGAGGGFSSGGFGGFGGFGGGGGGGAR